MTMTILIDMSLFILNFDLKPNLLLYFFFRERNERETISLKELQSNNKNFMKEKNIKYNLYPLYINWKKIETKESNNNHFKIYKLYGYFGSAIYSILEEVNKDCEDKFNYKNFIFELSNTYLKEYDVSAIDKFYDKLINIYEEVINLIKNKIIIFKEISVFLIIMRLFENYFTITNNNDKLFEVLKYQYMIISYITENEYNKIYNKYYQRYNNINIFSRRSFPNNKKSFIKRIKDIYKKIKKDNKK